MDFWVFFILGVILVVVGIICISRLTGSLKEEAIVCTIVSGLFLLYSGLVILLPNDSYLVVNKIVQNKTRYVIYTNRIKIYQKECSYKVGDTLWIRR
jgi:uncharacterized membrane protein